MGTLGKGTCRGCSPWAWRRPGCSSQSACHLGSISSYGYARLAHTLPTSAPAQQRQERVQRGERSARRWWAAATVGTTGGRARSWSGGCGVRAIRGWGRAHQIRTDGRKERSGASVRGCGAGHGVQSGATER